MDPRFCAHGFMLLATFGEFMLLASLSLGRRFLKDLDWIEVGPFHWHHVSESSSQFLAGDSAAVRVVGPMLCETHGVGCSSDASSM